MKPAIVITGVAGFIGSNLADRLLAEGYPVIGVDDLSAGVREQVPEGASFYHMDVRSPEVQSLIPEGSVVFHLAAKNCISDCQSDPLETASVNVTGTVNVLEAAVRAGASKVVYAESSALYEGTRVFPTPEAEVHPESVYAVSKLAARVFAEAYRRFHGLRLTALRYFCVYGPRQDYRRTVPPLMSALILALLRGERPVIYGSGKKRRDFVHVDDVNAFHLQCLTDPRTDGGTFNLGSGVNYSVLEIYERTAALLRSNVQPVFKPDLPGEALETLADISAAAAVGWRPRVSLEEGLCDFVDYYRKTGIPWKA